MLIKRCYYNMYLYHVSHFYSSSIDTLWVPAGLFVFVSPGRAVFIWFVLSWQFWRKWNPCGTILPCAVLILHNCVPNALAAPIYFGQWNAACLSKHKKQVNAGIFNLSNFSLKYRLFLPGGYIIFPFVSCALLVKIGADFFPR